MTRGVTPYTRRGDLYTIGTHKLLCGDSTSTGDVRRVMAGTPADLLLTDPPYNVDIGNDNTPPGKVKGREIANDSKKGLTFEQFLEQAFYSLFSQLRPGGSYYIWHADTTRYDFLRALKAVNEEPREVLVWVKDSFVMGRQDYHWQHEPCLYGWRSGAPHSWFGDRKQSTTLCFKRPKRSAEHPTMKPVQLFEYQIKQSTAPGQVVLDGFGGSGTTLIAAEQTGRQARLIEYDPKYCDTIVKRYAALTGKRDIQVERDGEQLTWDQIQQTAGWWTVGDEADL